MKPDHFITHPRHAGLDEIKRVAPQLLPLWWGLQQSGYLDGWEKTCPTNEVLRALKDAARRAGLTKTGWRYVCRLSEHQVLALVVSNERNFVRLGGIEMINLLARTGESPPPSPVVIAQVASLLRETGSNGEGQKSSLVAFVRAALHVLKDWSGSNTAFIDELTFVSDWFRHEHLGEDAAPLKARGPSAEWAWFLDKAEIWHREGFNVPPRKRGIRWDSLLGPFQLYGYDVVPLVTVEQLYDEANEMEHCIITYEKRCVEGLSRVFSIREREHTRATFELALRYDRWELIQVRGLRNSRPHPACKVIAVETLVRYRAAAMKQEQSPRKSGQSNKTT